MIRNVKTTINLLPWRYVTNRAPFSLISDTEPDCWTVNRSNIFESSDDLWYLRKNSLFHIFLTPNVVASER